MTDQQIFYQLLQCCPYDKTGFDAEEWESICQMDGAGKDSSNGKRKTALTINAGAVFAKLYRLLLIMLRTKKVYH